MPATDPVKRPAKQTPAAGARATPKTAMPKKRAAAWAETPVPVPRSTAVDKDPDTEDGLRPASASKATPANGNGHVNVVQKEIQNIDNGRSGVKPKTTPKRAPSPPSSESEESDSDSSSSSEEEKAPAPKKTPAKQQANLKQTPAKGAKATPAKPKPLNRLAEIAGFKLLPISMPPLVLTTDFPVSAKSAARFSQKLPEKELRSVAVTHNMYFRRHESRKEDGLPKGRTLFIAGIPADTTEYHLKNLFAECGPVQKIVWGDLPRSRQTGDAEDGEGEGGQELLALLPVPYLPHPGGTTIHLVFKTKDAADAALDMRPLERKWDGTRRESDMEEDTDGNMALPDESAANLVGWEKWKHFALHSHPDQQALSESVNAWIESYESAERSARLSALAQRNLTDEDGFTLVTRAKKGRNTTTGKGATVQSFRREETVNVKPKKKELQDFYRFQIRQKKVGELVELRKKFEEDKKKIAQLREARKFKPY